MVLRACLTRSQVCRFGDHRIHRSDPCECSCLAGYPSSAVDCWCFGSPLSTTPARAIQLAVPYIVCGTCLVCCWPPQHPDNMWTVARISLMKLRLKCFGKKKKKKISAVAISPWYWTSLAKKIYKLSYKEKPNAIGSTIHISTCKSTFPLCELQTLNTERWSSLICRHKNQSSSEVVNYIFVQSKERAGTEKSDLYRSGFYLCKLSRTPGVYTELYIEVWITV